MKILTVRQPWASLIILGINGIYKDIENRNWHAPQNLIGDRIGIHSAANVKREEIEDAIAFCVERGILKPGLDTSKLFTKPYLQTGLILGSVRLVDCVRKHSSPWFNGPFGFMVQTPRAFEKPVPAKGQLNFWEYDLAGVS